MIFNFFHLRVRLGRPVVCCLLLASPAVATTALAISMPQRGGMVRSQLPSQPVEVNIALPTLFGGSARPYLSVIAPTPMRFAQPVELPPEPPAPEPVVQEEPPPPAEAPAPSPVAPPTPAPEPVAVTTPPPEAKPAEAKRPKAVAILPDDTAAGIRAEDILPFFSFPDKGEPSGSVIVPFTPAQPRGATLPPSSARYEQK